MSTAPQSPPPLGYASWMECAAARGLGLKNARAELAALRKDLSDTKAQLAMQAENTVQAVAQRDEAVREIEEAEDLMHEAREDCEMANEERDEAQAKLAELREAALALGELTWCDGRWGDCTASSETASPDEMNAWNALIAKLRAETAAEGKEGT